MTINDGYGNANLAFNHASGVPDTNGNALRIETNVDSTTNANFIFEGKSNVSANSAVPLTELFKMTETGATCIGNEVWHAGNDGSGSGLDADTLDGQQGANYLRSNANDTMSGVLTISNSQPQIVFNETDVSTAARIILSGSDLFIQSGAAGSGTATSSGDIRITGYNATNVSSFTVRTGNAYNTIWHAGNDGANSGLDADTLDGQQGANYLRSNTADTVSGTLTFTSSPKLNDNVRINFGTSNSHSLRRDSTNLILDIPNGGTFFIRDTSGTASIKHGFNSNGNYNCNGTITADFFSGNGSSLTNVAAASVQVNNSTDQTAFALFANNTTAGQKTPLMSSLINANLNNGRLTSASMKATDLAGSGNRDVFANSNGVLVISSSDETLKTNINPITTQYDIIKQLNPVTFNWIDIENLGSEEEIGFIAQEIQNLIPQVVRSNMDQTLTVNYSGITVILTKALQEAITKIENLESRLNEAGL